MVKRLPNEKVETKIMRTSRKRAKRVNQIIERTQQFEKERDEILSSIRSPSIVIQLQKNMFLNASRLVDMFQSRDWVTGTGLNKKVLCDFMSSAQEAEKFKMDQSNWSKEAISENKKCIKKHMNEGLGILPFNKILFQTKFPFGGTNIKVDGTIYLNLFEYKNKNIEKNTIEYTHQQVRVVDNYFRYNQKEIQAHTITVPLDFSKIKFGEDSVYSHIAKINNLNENKKLFAMQKFLQLNSHTDKNTNIGVFDIKPKIDSGIGSFKVKADVVEKETFVPVWKSKTVYVRPEEYKPERDTTYTSDIEKDSGDSEPRYVPYHSVRGHVRRLQKGDITSVRSHFRGNKEHGAVFKDYVLQQPRLFRNGKEIW